MAELAWVDASDAAEPVIERGLTTVSQRHCGARILIERGEVGGAKRNGVR
jgi:hypothetical protein